MSKHVAGILIAVAGLVAQGGGLLPFTDAPVHLKVKAFSRHLRLQASSNDNAWQLRFLVRSTQAEIVGIVLNVGLAGIRIRAVLAA